MARMLVLFFIMLHIQFSSVDENINTEKLVVAVNSTTCSVTCGMGFKVQTICTFKDSEKAMEDKKKVASDTSTQEDKDKDDMEKCHNVTVRCRESWNCGIRTVTKTTGERLEMDCLVELMKQMKKLPLRVEWHHAPGLISSDDSLFTRWASPQVDQVILDPIKEEHAGTYCCDVLDSNFKKLKKVYWGVRVLPRGVLNLDYNHALDAHLAQPCQRGGALHGGEDVEEQRHI
ncbi:transmembrane protein 81 isoform X2 [Festucalex cinctus]